ncbi:hypothetical protein BKA70DRAFT_1267653 [Coprinopsis sp. MPI-PUGE-AT-0042]|nr:hypothetical protein BKA70DRAFT_1267653 [Coprinopsis sp. MPI-PUGE-AT-0042]
MENQSVWRVPPPIHAPGQRPKPSSKPKSEGHARPRKVNPSDKPKRRRKPTKDERRADLSSGQWRTPPAPKTKARGGQPLRIARTKPSQPKDIVQEEQVGVFRSLTPTKEPDKTNNSGDGGGEHSDNETILMYPFGGPGSISLTRPDCQRLQPGEYLNDNVIEFGIKRWSAQFQQINPTLAAKTHVFSTFFFKKLDKDNHAIGYSSVSRWTSKFNLFEKEYVIVPINKDLHWYLAVIVAPGQLLEAALPDLGTVPGSQVPLILVLDSLNGEHEHTIHQLEQYLISEAMAKLGVVADRSRITNSVAKVPEQPNMTDCGLYLLHFLRTFMSDPHRYIKESLGEQEPEETSIIWRSNEVPLMRRQLQEEIEELSNEWRLKRRSL